MLVGYELMIANSVLRILSLVYYQKARTQRAFVYGSCPE